MSESSLAFARNRIEVLGTLAERIRQESANGQPIHPSDLFDDADWEFCTYGTGSHVEGFASFTTLPCFADRLYPTMNPYAGEPAAFVVIAQFQGRKPVSFVARHMPVPQACIDAKKLIDPNGTWETIALTEEEQANFATFAEFYLADD